MSSVELPADTAEFASDVQSGPYSATFQFARRLIAALPTFREEILGVPDEASALLKIYKQETLAELDEQTPPTHEGGKHPEIEARPFCIIIEDGRNTERVGTSTWASDGAMFVAFEVPTLAEFKPNFDSDTPAVRADKFRRLVDWRVGLASRIEHEITQYSGGSDADGNPFLNVTRIDLVLPPRDMDEELDDEDFIAFAFRLEWK